MKVELRGVAAEFVQAEAARLRTSADEVVTLMVQWHLALHRHVPKGQPLSLCSLLRYPWYRRSTIGVVTSAANRPGGHTGPPSLFCRPQAYYATGPLRGARKGTHLMLDMRHEPFPATKGRCLGRPACASAPLQYHERPWSVKSDCATHDAAQTPQGQRALAEAVTALRLQEQRRTEERA